MDLSSIYLVENLNNYNFEDVVFLAADVNAIVEALLHPVVIKEAEQTLFLAQVLKTALHICRTVVCNYSTLEELLKVNWSSADNFTQKWQFFEQLTLEDPVDATARRILISKGGAQSIGIIQEFYRMYYSKETFKEMLSNVYKLIPAIDANRAFQSLKQSLSGTEANSLFHQQSKESNIATLVDYCNDKEFKNHIEKIRDKLNGSGSEKLLREQMQALKSSFSCTAWLERYQQALKCDAYYQLNLTALKLYHDYLLAKGILYDTHVIMMLHLLRQNGASDAVLRKEFCNESRFGAPERIRVVLLELQNFSCSS